MEQGFSRMLSMINPDTIQKIEQSKHHAATIHSAYNHHSQKGQHDYYADEMEDTVGAKMMGVNNSQTKTQDGFYNAHAM